VHLHKLFNLMTTYNFGPEKLHAPRVQISRYYK